MPTVLLQISLFLFLISYGFYRYNSHLLNKIKSDFIEKDGVYFIFIRPLNFIQFVNYWFGYGLGSLKIIVKLQETYLIYDYDTRLRIYCKHETKDRKHVDYLVLKLNPELVVKHYIMLDYFKFISDLEIHCLGKKWNFINNNCMNILKIPLKNQGIKISLLPARFFSRK